EPSDTAGITTEAISLNTGMAVAIITRPFVIIRKHFIGFVDFLEAGFGICVLAHIRVIFSRQPAERTFDVGFIGVTRYAQYVIIVSCHRLLSVLSQWVLCC